MLILIMCVIITFCAGVATAIWYPRLNSWPERLGFTIAIGMIFMVCLLVADNTNALAARPSLSLKVADAKAVSFAKEEVTHSEAFFDPTLPVGEFVYETPEGDFLSNYKIDSFEIDPCETDGRSRAECDVTFYYNDGDACDDTIAVSRTRRGKLAASLVGDVVCDSMEES